MTSYKIDLETGAAAPSSNYRFASEGSHLISPQAILASNPQMVLDIPDIDIQADDKVLVMREYPTSRGPIDILVITSNADIVIVETKLLRNSESHRTVVAQAIDYAKALTNETTNDIVSKLGKSNICDKALLADLKSSDFWRATLSKNAATGNFQIVILGDEIHPNVIGMVESIQSAPHLAFTLYLAELCPVSFGEGTVIVTPRVISKTLEIERSVIRIEIDHEKKTHKIESETPEKGGKGTKPILSQSQYLESIAIPEFKTRIERFLSDWRELGGDINFGTVGFSAGFKYEGKRVPLLFVYNDRAGIMNENHRLRYSISDELYNGFKEDMKRSSAIYDSYLVGNKVTIPFSEISMGDLEVLFQSIQNLAIKMTEVE